MEHGQGQIEKMVPKRVKCCTQKGDMTVKTLGNEVAVKENARVRGNQGMVKIKSANVFQY
jgi:hypothetical protein